MISSGDIIPDHSWLHVNFHFLACFKIQRNPCVTLLRKARRDYYENLELGKVNDSKKFWNTVKPVFRNKVTTRSNITLIGNKKVVTSKIELAKNFNKYLLILFPS